MRLDCLDLVRAEWGWNLEARLELNEVIVLSFDWNWMRLGCESSDGRDCEPPGYILKACLELNEVSIWRFDSPELRLQLIWCWMRLNSGDLVELNEVSLYRFGGEWGEIVEIWLELSLQLEPNEVGFWRFNWYDQELNHSIRNNRKQQKHGSGMRNRTDSNPDQPGFTAELTFRLNHSR